MKGLVVRLVLAVTGWGWVRRLFTRTKPGRRVALRFVAGETLDQAIEVARQANADGMPVSLNLLGEHVTDSGSAEACFEEYLESVDRIAAEGIDGNVSVKLTQLGMGLDDGLCARLLGRLAGRAAEKGQTITIDMEDSPWTDATLKMFREAQEEHGNLGVALQAYLRRTPEDLAAIAPLGGHVRLCKGAYDEPAEIAFRSRGEVNAAYDSLVTDLMASRMEPAIATHDEDRMAAAIAVAADRDEPWEFQMLFGIRRPLQRRLLEEGHALRLYIPYGEAWYPYLTRRIAERPANVWFFFRALFGR